MSELNSNIIYENNQVVFSKEILKYFELIKTEENKEWIEKYFQVLSDPSNINSEKYNVHHIRPCFTFKTNVRTKRKETKPFTDKFPNNFIKLSIYNHLFAHYYLWKTYNNNDSKITFQRMCGQSKYKDNLTENELVKIARLKEECAKKNQTEEEIKLYNERYSKSESRKQVIKKYYENNKHKQLYIYSQNKYYNSDKAKEIRKELNKRRYFDPITNNYYSHRNMIWRIKQFPSLYINIKLSDLKCISIDNEEYINWKEKCKFESENNKKEWYKNWVKLNREHLNENSRKRYCKNKEKLSSYKKKLRNRKCFDPIKNEECTYGQLENRKIRNKKLYKDVIIKKCLINQ